MLEARNLTKSYNGKEALREVSFTVKPGDIFCLLGANGAGKTTTINLFLNFVSPTSGQGLIPVIQAYKTDIHTVLAGG